MSEDLLDQMYTAVDNAIVDGDSYTPIKAADAAWTVLSPVLEKLQAEVNGLRRENTRLREENTRHKLNAEADVCTGCLEREQQRDAAWETSRQSRASLTSSTPRASATRTPRPPKGCWRTARSTAARSTGRWH
jgi:hypothetical protein